MQPREGGCCSSTSIFQVDFCFNTQPRGGGCSFIDFSRPGCAAFQHTAARRRLHSAEFNLGSNQPCFNTQPRGGGCKIPINSATVKKWFQHTAARRRLPFLHDSKKQEIEVSTHSRAEAAASKNSFKINHLLSFNTQPRGGGCTTIDQKLFRSWQFQHTAARRRLSNKNHGGNRGSVRFNTQPRGGGCKR